MAHIHTKYGEHDHVVTMYVIRTDMDEPRALLHRHRKLGKYLPIGGHVELSESPWQAVAHELREMARRLTVDEIKTDEIHQLIADIRYTNETKKYGMCS